MRGMRWAWLALTCGGCVCLQVTDEERVVDAGVDAGRPLPRPDASVVFPPPVQQPPCVTWQGDAGDCDGGQVVFDGTSCRPACLQLDAGDPRAFSRELDCVLACQCDQSKFNRPFTEATACDWLLLFTSGPLDWDAGSCEVPPNWTTSCIAWTGTLVGQGTGSPLLEDGVRLACAASLQSQVKNVYCDVWLE